jgi:UDP-glucuronate 4-epimerase
VFRPGTGSGARTDSEITFLPDRKSVSEMAHILVTGAAGFIGFHTASRLLDRGDRVTGLDNLNDYYNPQLKRDRLAQLQPRRGFDFAQTALEDRGAISDLFRQHRFDSVIHLAAQAGVRYSLTHPHAYVDSNLVGFTNILEACRHHDIKHLVYASSSSVYGANRKIPFSVDDRVDHPVSLYAATKKANELMAHTYSHLFELPTTGLRFFTVYGPWGRPDMAMWLFTEAILKGQPIDVFNHGQMRRDFTYVDDIVEGVIRVNDRIPVATPCGSAVDDSHTSAPWRVYNIGRPAEMRMLPMQPGDVPATYADIDALQRDVGFRPATPIETGIARFVDWYRTYHRIPA